MHFYISARGNVLQNVSRGRVLAFTYLIGIRRMKRVAGDVLEMSFRTANRNVVSKFTSRHSRLT